MRFPLIAVRPLPATLVLSLAVAGCGGGGGAASGPAATSTAPAKKPAAAAKPGQTLSLSADESGGLYFNPKKLTGKAGSVKLVMHNPASSGLMHGIAVEGNGVDKDGPVVAAGKTSTLTVTLKPGKYEFYCPFDSHKQMGMKGTLTVT